MHFGPKQDKGPLSAPTLPSSITDLKDLSLSMNLSTLFISLVAADQDLSLGLPSSRMITTAVMSSTPERLDRHEMASRMSE